MGRNRSLDTVLLVKPMGVSARGELEKLDLETSLLIIPSIIMSSVTDAGSRPPRAAPWSRSRAVVPLVEGELIESAERILRRNGFSLGETRDIESSQYAAGAVISQDPPAYERGDDTTEVSVLVSSGPPKGPNVMPDFVGRDVAEVSEWLRQKQLPSSVIHKVSNPVVPEGMVVSQSPRAGAKTDGNTEIVFYVNAGN
jgi:beta-lactam-binding protein with PASTA domain